MRNEQAQRPTGGQTKITKTRGKQKRKQAKYETTAMIKATKIATTDVGEFDNGFIFQHIESKI